MKSLLFAKLEDSILRIQEDCLSWIQEILERHNLQYTTFVTVVGEKACDLSQVCLSALNFFGCLEVDQEPLLEEEEDVNVIDQASTQGIFLLPSYRYTTAYAKDATSGFSFPVNVGVFGLVINASRASVREYALLINYLMIVCSHTIFVNPLQNHKVSLESFKAYVKRFMVTNDAAEVKLVSIIQSLGDPQLQKTNKNHPVDALKDIKQVPFTVEERTVGGFFTSVYLNFGGEIREEIARILQERSLEMGNSCATTIVHLWDQIRNSVLQSCNQVYQFPNLLPGFFEELIQEIVNQHPIYKETFKEALEIKLLELPEKCERFLKWRCETLVYKNIAKIICPAEEKRNPALKYAIAQAFEPEWIDFDKVIYVNLRPYEIFMEEVMVKLMKIEMDFYECAKTGKLCEFSKRLASMYGHPIIIQVEKEYQKWKPAPMIRPTHPPFVLGLAIPKTNERYTRSVILRLNFPLIHHYGCIRDSVEELLRYDDHCRNAFLKELASPKCSGYSASLWRGREYLEPPKCYSRYRSYCNYSKERHYVQIYTEQAINHKYKVFKEAADQAKRFIRDELLSGTNSEKEIIEAGQLLFLKLGKSIS